MTHTNHKIKNKSIKAHNFDQLCDDDVYLRLQHGKRFHDLVCMSYVKDINPANKA
jgi:hypothetical protein